MDWNKVSWGDKCIVRYRDKESDKIVAEGFSSTAMARRWAELHQGLAVATVALYHVSGVELLRQEETQD